MSDVLAGPPAPQRLPRPGRALEQQHAAVLPDGQKAGDEIRLHHRSTLKTPPARMFSGSRTRGVYDGSLGLYETIRRGGHASTSRRSEKCKIGSVSDSVTPICSVIASVSTSACAGRRDQRWWWMSPRRTFPFPSAV